MSATTNNLKVEIASKDIICYKYCQYNLESSSITSFFMRECYEIGKEYTDVIKFKKNPEITIIENGSKSVEDTWSSTKGIHSFQKLSDCVCSAECASYISGLAVCKCIIPKGSSYVIATNNAYTKDKLPVEVFVSEKIILSEIMMILKSEDLTDVYAIDPDWGF